MEKINLKKILELLKYLAIYALSSKMICFAIPKILFMQFRITHWQSYVPLAEISKYHHMWSFFGRSYNYNLFIGITEFLIGGLILFKRTRLIALLLALGLCTNILILNIEFNIHFAISHITLDLAITIILLSSYRNDLYKFFIKLGGKLDGSIIRPKSKFTKLFPYAFLIILSVCYFIFSLSIKSKYIVDENVIGAYKIKTIKVNDSVVELNKGNLGKNPMMFIEHNNQFVLSIEDTLYMGRYILDTQEITIYLDNPTKFGMTSLIGALEIDTIRGKIDKERSIEMFYERIDGSKNYLNDLYK